jgi:hypothetical protein
VSRRPLFVVALSVTLAIAGGVGASSGALARTVAPAPVIDRTLLCSTLAIGGGLHQFEIRARAGVRENPTTWKSLPFAAARSGHITRGPAQLDNSIAWIAAGRASPKTNLEELDPLWPYPAKTHGTLALNQELCRPSKARVRLTGKGLDGGVAGPFGDEYDCPAPRRVLVRVRATLQARAPIYRDDHFLKTRADLKSAYLSIRTRSGKPLAFAAVFESGKARLLTAAGCLSD